MKNDIGLTNFIHLLLIELSNQKLLIDIRHRNIKNAILPLNYKEVIEEILCAGNGWNEEFSILINTSEYFKDHFTWEKDFTKELNRILKEMGKEPIYDLEYDRIIIPFTEHEIKKLKNMNNLMDKELNDIINHFATLLNDWIFTRKYKEEFIPHKNITERNTLEIKKQNDQIKEKLLIKSRRN